MIVQSAISVPSNSRKERIDGRAMLAFSKRGIRDMTQVAPARLLFPEGREGDFPLVLTANTSGSLAGGDRLALTITVDPEASATIVPQAPEKIYCALPEEEPTKIETRIAIGEGGCCEWLAQEVILFDRSRMQRSLDVDLAADARLLAMEMVVLGRDAMGGAYSGGLIHDAWKVRRNGRLIWADTLHLEGEFAAHGEAPFEFGSAQAIATIVYAGPDAADHLELARTLMVAPSGTATRFDGLIILRLTRDDPQALRRDVMRAAGVLRAAIFGVSPSMAAIGYR